MVNAQVGMQYLKVEQPRLLQYQRSRGHFQTLHFDTYPKNSSKAIDAETHKISVREYCILLFQVNKIFKHFKIDLQICRVASSHSNPNTKTVYIHDTPPGLSRSHV